MNKKIEKHFLIGGSVEKALSGDYELSPGAVLKEAWECTIKHFMSFLPAIIFLLFVQLTIFYIALKLQLGDPALLFDLLKSPGQLEESQNIITVMFISSLCYEVISAPIYAGVSFMAMSHVAGLSTKPSYMLQGVSFAVSAIVVTLISLMIQSLANAIIPLFLSTYFSIAFGNAILLVCEKKLSPWQSLWLSLRAANKKLLPLASIYMFFAVIMFVSLIFYGIPLILILPLFFHAKGIIYRNMFGVSLKLIANNSNNNDKQDDNSSSNNDHSGDNNSDSGTGDDRAKDSEVFNA